MNYLKLLLHRRTKLIHRTQNEIHVYQHGAYRWILFNYKFIQTMMHIRKPHKMLLPYLHSLLIFTKTSPGPVLLLGLGGGAAIHILTKTHPSETITVVEKYPEMIELAQKFFFLPKSQNLHIICNNAYDYIQDCKQKFKHILIDLGDESGFPQDCMHPSFFKTVFNLVADDGILCLNVSQNKELIRFKTIFTSVLASEPLIIHANGNWIICLSKHGKTYPLNILKQWNLIKMHVWEPNYGEYVTLNSNQISVWITRCLRFASLLLARIYSAKKPT